MMRLEISRVHVSAPAVIEYTTDGATVTATVTAHAPCVVRLADGAARQRYVLATQRAATGEDKTAAGIAIIDIQRLLSAEYLVSTELVLVRDGEDWPLPGSTQDRVEWLGYLPAAFVGALADAIVGAGRRETEPGNG